MGVIMSEQFKFTWSEGLSAEANFYEWYTLNCEERSAYNEPRLTREEAANIFNEMYDVSVDIKGNS
tara:strand:- start:53 stop:250 length:198 start_codon:yes stop_codon:yes gene_type:complete